MIRKLGSVSAIELVDAPLDPAEEGGVVFSDGAFLQTDAQVFYWDDVNNRLSLGSQDTTWNFSGSPFGSLFSLHQDSGQDLSMMTIHRYDPFFAPTIDFTRSRGTRTSPIIVTTGNLLGHLRFSGYDGSTYLNGAQIVVNVEGVPSAGLVSASMNFYTTDSVGASNLWLTLTGAGLFNVSSDIKHPSASPVSTWIIENLASGAITSRVASTQQFNWLSTNASTGQMSFRPGTSGVNNLTTFTGAYDAEYVVPSAQKYVLKTASGTTTQLNVTPGNTSGAVSNKIEGTGSTVDFRLQAQTDRFIDMGPRFKASDSVTYPGGTYEVVQINPTIGTITGSFNVAALRSAPTLNHSSGTGGANTLAQGLNFSPRFNWANVGTLTAEVSGILADCRVNSITGTPTLTTLYGIDSLAAIISSGVVTSAIGMRSRVFTQSGGTITTGIGLQTTGAFPVLGGSVGTSIAFQSVSGFGATTLWNAQFTGTAPSYFQGRLINAENTFVSGLTVQTVAAVARFAVNQDAAASRWAILANRAATTDGVQFGVARSRGTIASPSVVSAGDVIYRLEALAHDGTDFHLGAEHVIGIVSGSSISNNSIDTFQTLSVAQAGTLYEAIRISGVSSGARLAFFGGTPAAKAATYTQTYSTATRTQSNLTSATLTDSTGGTANTTLVAIAPGIDLTSNADINNNFADLAAQVNALRVDLENVKQITNSLIDDEQSFNLAG